MPDTALVIMAKAPRLGQVKTRLAAKIGHPQALAVYRALLAHTAAAAAGWRRGPVLLSAAGQDHDEAWRGTGLESLPRHAQPEAGLGTRVGAALRWGMAVADRCLVIGSDCPACDTTALGAIATLLDKAPVALGPAEDGGYWAVAVADGRAVDPLASEGLPWSTPALLSATCAALDASGFCWNCGPLLRDCDTYEDLESARAAGHLFPENL